MPFSAALLNNVITPSTHLSVPDYVVIDGKVFHDAEEHGLEDMGKDATALIRQHPIPSVLIGFGVGCLLGMALSRR